MEEKAQEAPIAKANYLLNMLGTIVDKDKIQQIFEKEGLALIYIESENPGKALYFVISCDSHIIANATIEGVSKEDNFRFAVDVINSFRSSNEPKDEVKMFRSREEVKESLIRYLDIGNLAEARDYILRGLPVLTEQEAKALLLNIEDELVSEGRLVNYHE